MDLLNSMMITCPTTINKVSGRYESDQFADVTEINLVATFTNNGPNPMKFSNSTPPDIWSVPDILDIPVVTVTYTPAEQFIAPGENFVMNLTIDVSGLDAANDKFAFWLHDVMYYGNNTTNYTTLQSVTFSCN